jgi:hypothetical protein
MHDLLQPGTAPRPGLRDALVKPLGEDPPRAGIIAAAEASNLEPKPNSTPMSREIAQAPFIPAMDLRGRLPAHRAGRCSRWRPRNGNEHIASVLDALDNQTIRQHGADAKSETHVHPRATSWVPFTLTALSHLIRDAGGQGASRGVS